MRSRRKVNMAHQDVEIEIKFCLTKALASQLEKKLNKVAKFLGESRQIDRYFNAPHRDFLKLKHPVEYLRLRESNGTGSINYKYWHKDRANVSTHCDELESNISNTSSLNKLLMKLDFKEYLTIDKTRKSYNLNGEFEIDLDEVKDLGHFAEIETMRDFGSVEKARMEIIKVAKNLGINITKIEKHGYVLALMQKKKLTK
jgi:adenylate cyclase, class 2